MRPDPALSSLASSPSATALWLGRAGLIPFVALALAVWLGVAPGPQAHARWLIGYAALIASFLGGIHWGLVMRQPPGADTARALWWGVAPSLLAWLAWLMPASAALLWLAAVLALCFMVDRSLYLRAGAQGWLGLRLQLTVVAGLSCALAAVALR